MCPLLSARLQADGWREERGVDHYPQGGEGGTVRQSWSGEGRSRSQLAPPTEEVPPPPPPPAADDDADDDVVGLIVLCVYVHTSVSSSIPLIHVCCCRLCFTRFEECVCCDVMVLFSFTLLVLFPLP